MIKKIPFLWAVALIVSCGGARMYLNEEADMGFYGRVGVAPFSNLTSDRNASQKVTASFVNELLMIDAISLANAGDFDLVLSSVLDREMANVLESLSSEHTRTIGQEADVGGIFIGAVKDFGMVRSGYEEFPLVAVVVRFIDCETGTVVWSYETSRKGGPKFPIFSFGETHTLGNMTTKVCREIAEAFGDAME